MPTTYSFDEIKQTLTVYDNHGVTDFCEENNLDIAEFNYLTVIAKKVTNCDNLFKGCSAFNHPITIPSTVKRCNRMFSSCTSLKQTVVIPSTVVKHEKMFEGCPLMNEDGTPKEASTSGTYTFSAFALDVDTFITVFKKHPNYKEWFTENFPNGASSKDEVLAKCV